MTNSQLTKFYSNLGFIENKIDYCAIVDFCDDLAVVSAWEQKKGVYNSSETHKNKTITPFLKEGRFFDKAENNNPDGNQIFVTTAVGNVGDTISVYDKEYTVIGTYNLGFESTDVVIPYVQLGEKSRAIYTSIHLKRPLSNTEYYKLSDIAKESFGEKIIFPEFDGIENETDKRVNKYIYVVIILFIVVCVFNNYILFQRFLEKRRNVFAVERIVGCSRKQAFGSYMIKLLIASIIILMVSVLIYRKIILIRLVDKFEYIFERDNIKVYFQIGMAYILSLIVTYFILVKRYVNRKIVTLLKEI